MEGLYGEFLKLTLLEQISLALTLAGVSLTSIVLWLWSLTRLGKQRQVAEGLRAELSLARQEAARSLRAQRDAEERLEQSSIAHVLAVIAREKRDRNSRSIDRLFELDAAQAKSLAEFHREKALYELSLVTEEDREQRLAAAMRAAYIAHYLDPGAKLAAMLARETSELQTDGKEYFVCEEGRDWIIDAVASDQPIHDLLAASHRLFSKGYFATGLALIERAWASSGQASASTWTRSEVSMHLMSALMLTRLPQRHPEVFAQARKLAGMLEDPVERDRRKLIVDRHEGEHEVTTGNYEQGYALLTACVEKMAVYYSDHDEERLLARVMRVRAATSLKLAIAQEALETSNLYDKHHGPTYNGTLTAKFWAAEALAGEGRCEEALEILEAILPLTRTVKGESHPDLLSTQKSIEKIRKSLSATP